MKICIFAKYLKVHIDGGLERHTQGLIEGLIGRNHEVTVLTSSHPGGIEEEEEDNLKIYYLDDGVRYPIRGGFHKSSAQKFRELEEDFDIVHSQSTLGAGFVKYIDSPIPFVVTMHGTSFNEIMTVLRGGAPKKNLLAIPLWLYNYFFVDSKVLNRADKIISVNKKLRDDIKRQYNIPSEKLVTIFNGIDTDRFKPMEARNLRKKHSLTGERVVLSVGAMKKEKGVHILLQAFSKLLKNTKKVKLIIVGTGPWQEKLKKMAENLRIKDDVVFLGRVTDEELINCYSIADIFAFPTMRVEGLPMVLLESMACKTPVIASGIGGMDAVIDNSKNGFLIEPNNVEELSNKLLEVLSDEDYLKVLKENSQKKIKEEFSLKGMVENTEKVYGEVLK